MLQEVKPEIQRMEYRSLHLPELPESFLWGARFEAENKPEVADQEVRLELQARIEELETRLAERESQFTRQIEEERRQVMEQERSSAVSEHAALLKRCAHEIGGVIERFQVERDTYLAQLEHEVVRLALAIAGRVLNREIQMDPLLLSGVVRVALGQLEATTEVRLRVPEGERELWSEMLRLLPNLPLRPELIADAEMRVGECVLETHLGSVNLGVKAQLEEIERGFFDLLGRRDQVKSAISAFR